MAAEYFVSVVAPLHDDADIVDGFVRDTIRVLRESYSYYELVLVDDGSTDDTLARLEHLLRELEGVRVIRLSRRFGEEVALSAGLDAVIGDYAVTMLPDSDPPELIPEIVDQAREGSGVVFGVRRERSGEPFAMRAFSRLFYWVAARIAKIDIPRNSTQFRVFSRQALNAILEFKDRSRYLRVLAVHIGYANRSFVYRTISRSGKPRRKGFVEAINLAVDVIVAGSRRPLRLVSALGVFASALSLIYSGYVIVVYLVKDRPAEGWTTLSLQASGMFFLLFVLLTVVSEYVGQILAEARGRPLYHVLEELTSQVLVPDEGRRNVVTDVAEEAPVAGRRRAE